MRRRLIAAAAALLAGIVAVPASAAHSNRTALSVTGPAGTAIWVQVSPGTELNNTGRDTPARADHGGWAGVAIVQPGSAHEPGQVFASVSLPASFRCPGQKCPWIAPPAALTSDPEGQGLLAPGRYRLVLLGTAGSTVHATVFPSRGHVSLLPGLARQRVRMVSASTVADGMPGHEVALHAYHQIPAAHGWGLVMSAPTFVIEPAGVVADSACMTAGSDDAVFNSVGGVAPCADFHGEDFIVGPDAAPSTPDYGAVPVNMMLAAVYGPLDGDPLGVGWDVTTTAPTSFLREAFVGFSLPR